MAELTLTPAPIGVGFITCHPSVTHFRQTTLPILEKYSTYPPFTPCLVNIKCQRHTIF